MTAEEQRALRVCSNTRERGLSTADLFVSQPSPMKHGYYFTTTLSNQASRQRLGRPASPALHPLPSSWGRGAAVEEGGEQGRTRARTTPGSLGDRLPTMWWAAWERTRVEGILHNKSGLELGNLSCGHSAPNLILHCDLRQVALPLETYFSRGWERKAPETPSLVTPVLIPFKTGNS